MGERPVVVPYDPTWRTRATDLVDDLRRALGPRARRIEHIGSTSIPGMAAKPILDLQVSVDDLDDIVDAFADPLRTRGFVQSSYRHDHVPAGCGDPQDRWVKRLWSRRGGSADPVNLHVRTVGSPNERLALLFRDWFRAHPEAVPGYARFKGALADVATDMDAYQDVKDPVVDLVVAVAERWAAETGWAP